MVFEIFRISGALFHSMPLWGRLESDPIHRRNIDTKKGRVMQYFCPFVIQREIKGWTVVFSDGRKIALRCPGVMMLLLLLFKVIY